MLGFVVPALDGFLLAIIGAALCVNMICTANYMPQKTPWALVLMIAGAFAAGVGMTVTAWTGDISQALRFALGAVAMLLGQSIWLWIHGYQSWDFLERLVRHTHHDSQ